MAVIRPFRALRPKAQLAERICELPYDVMSSEEAREIAKGNSLSFLRVSKPEIDLPKGTDVYAAAVYAKGRENFQKLIAQGALAQDQQPSFYLYRQVMGNHSQAGLVAVASCEEYLRGVIRKHELTRPDKEDDRVRHIEALTAQTGPAFLVYRAVPELKAIIAKKVREAPEVDFTAQDGIRHSAWTIGESQAIETAFAKIPFLYIADGHHRTAAAARVFQAHKGAGHSGWFLTVIFAHDEIQILPYNRALVDLNGHTPTQLLQKLERVFEITTNGSPQPATRHELGFYLQRNWRTLQFRSRRGDKADALDVSLLQEHVLQPLFGINDPRTSQRIQFVGGIRGTRELERLVDSGQCACAFSMYPTGIDQLMAIADAGEIMPPKSTWFEPKLRDGMFCHMI